MLRSLLDGVRRGFAWIIRVLRDYTRDILIALILAVVAAVALDIYRHHQQSQATLNNLKAVATLYAKDKDGNITGQGSGFFVTSTGILATNYHVIKGATSIVARLPTGAIYLWKGIRDTDERADIAILQFDATETPSVRGLGDSDTLQIGEQVYAIGTPVSQEQTVSIGNVSKLSQEIKGERLIQFTAPISPGSSGGGLFDMDGKVIGITAAFLNAPSAQNLNFAVPINSVRNVLNGELDKLVAESPAYYYSLGNIADNRKEWDDAIRYYRKAAAIDDTYGDAYIGLGGDYYEKGDFKLEVANYLNATVAEPNSDQAFYLLGTAYEDIGEFDKAIEAYMKALEIDRITRTLFTICPSSMWQLVKILKQENCYHDFSRWIPGGAMRFELFSSGQDR
jgi:tetratricopeptide (TPR) repeat protein